ncbi:MAG: hypothetical protein CMQ57_03425 [Gammaproteobacteria bacterium]|nr:hypothetical protein [Gammaproteobacteria bacterium]
MDQTSRAILFCGGGGPSGPEYIGTYKFTTPRTYNGYQWQVPAQTQYIQAVAWGSGAYGYTGNSRWCPYFGNAPFCGTNGGGGGFSTAVIPVTAGEYLYIGVGSRNSSGNYNGAKGNGGGFTGIFRGSTPLIIAGGGGAGSIDGHGGAGGGASVQNVITVSSHNPGSYLSGGTPDGGGGYQGGNSSHANSNGGTGYATATGNLYTTTIAGTDHNPPEVNHSDYVSGHGKGAINHMPAGANQFGYMQGLLVIHALGGGYDPANNPSTVIPASRTILGTY